MFTSEDGKKFYFINYDNDTINGLRNDGYLMYPPTITRQSLDESYTTDVYAYAGHDSRLWNYLEADTEFMRIVQTIDASLYNAGLTYANAIRMFDDEQSAKWCERVYNRDAEYKYISPYIESGTNNLFMLQGSRQSHRKWWLSKRFSFIDSLFVSGEYKSNVVEVKLANAPIGVSFDITAGQQGNYGYGVNNVPISYGIPLEKNEKKTFTTVQVLNVGDPLRIYAAPSLLDVNLGNFIEYVSTLNITGVYTESLGTKLKSLNLGVDSNTSTKRNTSLKVISGLASAKSLEILNIEGYQGITSLDFTELKKLKTLNAFASGLTSVSLFDGSPIELLELPLTIQSISLVNANKIPSSGLVIEDSWKSVTTINIRNCQGLCSDFNLINTWFTNKTTANSKCSLTMEGIVWTDVNPLDLISLAALKTDGGVLSLKGTIRLESITLEQIDQIKSLYGDNVFTKGSELFVSAPDTAFILGAKRIIEGDSLQLSYVVVSEYQGSVTWSIASGSDVSISQSGLLTTTETGSARTIVVRLKHTPTQGSVITTTVNISVVKAVRPTSASVNGSDRISTDSEYTLSVSPTGINRNYSVEWSLSGSAFTNGHVAIKSSDKDSCIVKMVDAKGYGKFELTATITMDNGSKLQSTKMIFVGTTLTVNISSNQGTDSTISAIKANVTFGSTTIEATSGEFMHIPVGESIKVSYPKVDGYTQPSDYTFTSTTADATASAIYSTTIVSVTMSDNQTSLNDIASVKATIKYDSVSTSLASGGSVKIPTGKSVTITWSSVNGYATPAANTFTATGTSMQYEGVYNTTIVKVIMADNQTAYNDISGTTATVSASGMTTATVSSNGTVKVPTGSSCTITWSAVNGYKTPDRQIFTTSGTSVTKTGTYQTEIVTVNVTSDIDLPSSFSITVNGQGSIVPINEIVDDTTVYTIIKSISSSGAEYINTGVIPNKDTRVVMKGAYDFTTNSSLFGSRINSASGMFTMTYVYSNKYFLSNYASGYQIISASEKTDFILDKNKNVTRFNGSVYTDEYEDFSTTNPLFLFATNGNGSPVHYGKMDIEYVRIYNNGILERDYIPVVNPDGVAGLYDLVNGTFNSSATSSSFSANYFGNTEQMEQSSTTRVYKVPFGTNYTVSATAADGYNTPETQTFTASQASRTVVVEYLGYTKLTGVFIQAVDGTLYTASEFSSDITPNGIAVITDNCEFVIALQDVSNYSKWSGSGLSVSNVAYYTDYYEAIKDYAGETNTDTIIACLAGRTSDDITGAPSAEKCRGFKFPNGRKGYLGSAGEWRAVLDNYSTIASALSICGGSAFPSIIRHWTSTQYDLDYSWYSKVGEGSIMSTNKGTGCYVRAFASINEPSEFEFTVNDVLYKAKRGMTWAEFVDSDYNTGRFYSSSGSIYHSAGSLVLNNIPVEDTFFVAPLSYNTTNQGGGAG